MTKKTIFLDKNKDVNLAKDIDGTLVTIGNEAFITRFLTVTCYETIFYEYCERL